jgi:hypothetical protein
MFKNSSSGQGSSSIYFPNIAHKFMILCWLKISISLIRRGLGDLLVLSAVNVMRDKSARSNYTFSTGCHQKWEGNCHFMVFRFVERPNKSRAKIQQIIFARTKSMYIKLGVSDFFQYIFIQFISGKILQSIKNRFRCQTKAKDC